MQSKLHPNKKPPTYMLVWKETRFKRPMSSCEEHKRSLLCLNNCRDHHQRVPFLVKKKCSCQKLSEFSPRSSTLSRNRVFHVLQDGLEAHTYQGRGTTEREWKRVVSGLCQAQLCYFSCSCIQESANMHACDQ